MTGRNLVARNVADVAVASGVFAVADEGEPADAAAWTSDVNLVRDLVDLGRMSLSLTTRGVFRPEDMDGFPGEPPDPVLDAVLLDYALEVAPRREGPGTIVDASRLRDKVEDMRQSFGYRSSGLELARAVAAEAARRQEASIQPTVVA